MKEEQLLPDKVETELKVHLQMMGYKNDKGKDFTLNIQNKLVDVLIIKRNK